MVEEAPGDEVDDLALALDHALHAEQARVEELAALALDQVAPDHHVDAAGFVLEGHENHPARGIRALPAGHEPYRAHRAAMGIRTQVFGLDHFHFLQMPAQQREGMPAERQPEARVIGDDVLALGWRRKRRYFLFFLKNI